MKKILILWCVVFLISLVSSIILVNAEIIDRYSFDSGDSIVIGGKSIKLVRVGSAGSTVIDVDGTTDTIAYHTSKVINGIEVYNEDTYYDANNQAASSAILIIKEINLNFCEKGIVSNGIPSTFFTADLTMDIMEPDEGDNFKIKDKINIEVNIENEGDDDLDVAVESILYDLGNDREITKVKSNVEEIKDGNEKRFEFELPVPIDNNLDEGNRYVMFIKAFEDGAEDQNCNFNGVKLDFERNRDDVITKNIQTPTSVKKAETFNVHVTTENIGTRNQNNAYIRIINSELGIDITSNPFNINKAGDANDEVTKDFSLFIPKNVAEKSYILDIRLYDEDNDIFDNGREFVTLNVQGTMPNRAPDFIEVPETIQNINEGNSFTLNVQTNDLDRDPVTLQWLLDNTQVSTTNSFTYSPNYDSSGSHSIKVIASDGQLTTHYVFTVNVQNVPKAPTTSKFTGIDLTKIPDLKNAKNIILERTEKKSKIDFGNTAIDISNNPDLDNNIIIEKDLVAIDTSKLTNFQNKPAKIFIENLNFDETPIIYYNSGFTTNPNLINTVCPIDICSNIVYENNVLSFDVSHFSSFFIGEDFEEIEECSFGIKGKLDLTIKEPDNNNKFDIGKNMPIEIEVKNNDNENKDVNVEAVLYDLDEDEEVERADDNDEIKKGNSKTFNLEIEIPKSVDESDDHMLYVKVYDDDDEDDNCNEKSVKIKIQREDANLVINNLFLTKLENRKAKISIEVENEGKDKVENAYIELKNPQLNLNLRSETFDLNEYDKSRNKITKEFIVEVPEDVNAGAYSIESIVNFDSERESRFVSLNIEEEKIKESMLTISTDSKINKKRANVHLFINNKLDSDIVGRLNLKPIGTWFDPMENQLIVLNPESNNIYLSLKVNNISKGSYGATVTIIPEDKSLEIQEGTLIFEVKEDIKEKGFFARILSWFINLF